MPTKHTYSLLVPLLRGHSELFRAVHAPARPILFRGAEVLPDLHFQDFCHLGCKLRVRLCGRRAHGVILGSGRASIFLLLRDELSGVAPDDGGRALVTLTRSVTP